MSTQKKFSAFFATLIELPFRKTTFNKRLKVIFNGEENDYPERVSRLIPNSITARQCKKLFRQFLTGRGYGDQNETIVNKKKKIKLIHFINYGNDEYAEQAGIAVHVQYKADGSKDRVEVIDFCSVRKGKKDDKDYSGMIAVSALGHFNGVNAKQLTWCYTYNPDPDIVKGQIEKSKGLAKYPGQILIFKIGIAITCHIIIWQSQVIFIATDQGVSGRIRNNGLKLIFDINTAIAFFS